MAQDPLFTRRDLLNHGASSDFLGYFRLRPIELQVQVGGALGTMTVSWRYQGDSTWSSPEPSVAGTSWTWEVPDPSWASATFAAHAYTAGDTWTVAPDETVTPQGSAPATVTSSRTDVVTQTIVAVTSQIVGWTQPRVVPPILTLGEGQKAWAAQIAVYRLKSRQGYTPDGAGDQNLRALALDAETNFVKIGESGPRPPDLVDSSASNMGSGLSLLPMSDTLRGW